MKFYFKAEANSKIGGGHLHRCIAIAQEVLIQGHQVAFIFANSNSESIQKVKNLDWEVHELEQSEELQYQAYTRFVAKGSFLLFDTDNHLFYSGLLIDNLREANIITACYTITDQHPISTDILVNTNVISKTHRYQTSGYTQQIIGSEYLIFNTQFRSNPNFKSANDSSTNALVFLGNADFNQITTRVMKALDDGNLAVSKVHLLIGGLNPNANTIQELAKQMSYPIEIHQNVTDMKSLYAQTNVAITAAGMSMWEMALYQIPQIVIASSDREKTYTSYLANHKYIHLLGDYIQPDSFFGLNATLNQVLTKNKLDLTGFKELLDPNGIQKMVSKFIELSSK